MVESIDFPVPFLLRLKEFLTFRDVRRLRQVNRSWYTVFSKKLFANLLISDYYISVYDAFYYENYPDGSRKSCETGLVHSIDFISPTEGETSESFSRKNYAAIESFLANFEAFAHVEVKCHEPLTDIRTLCVASAIKKAVCFLKLTVFHACKSEVLGKYLDAYMHKGINVDIEFPPWIPPDLSEDYAQVLMCSLRKIPPLQSLTTHGYLFETPWATDVIIKNLKVLAHRRNENVSMHDALFPPGVQDLIRCGLETLTVIIEPAYLRGFVTFLWDEKLKHHLVMEIDRLLDEIGNAKVKSIMFVCCSEALNEETILKSGCSVMFTDALPPLLNFNLAQYLKHCKK